MDSTRHAGRTVVISGAAHGIGAATAERLYREGASLVLADINQSGLDVFASSFDDITRIASQVVDVGEEDQLLTMIDRAITAFGKLDVLINNARAGVMGTVTASLHIRLAQSDDRRSAIRVPRLPGCDTPSESHTWLHCEYCIHLWPLCGLWPGRLLHR